MYHGQRLRPIRRPTFFFLVIVWCRKWTASAARANLVVQVGTNTEERSDEDKSLQRPPGFPSVQPALLLELKRYSGCHPGALSCSAARPDHACRASSANMEFQ